MMRTAVASSPVKRLIDLLLAILAIALLLPVLALIAVIIKLDTDGPALSRRPCLGLNSRRFDRLRFRTYVNGEGSEWGGRLTTVGRLLRCANLDGLPMLFNIIIGHMSFVGPKSYSLKNDRYFAALVPQYEQRFNAPPGLIGLAEVRGLSPDVHSRDDLEKRLACDFEYIENWSLKLDMETLLKTIPLMFNKPGRE